MSYIDKISVYGFPGVRSFRSGSLPESGLIRIGGAPSARDVVVRAIRRALGEDILVDGFYGSELELLLSNGSSIVVLWSHMDPPIEVAAYDEDGEKIENFHSWIWPSPRNLWELAISPSGDPLDGLPLRHKIEHLLREVPKRSPALQAVVWPWSPGMELSNLLDARAREIGVQVLAPGPQFGGTILVEEE